MKTPSTNNSTTPEPSAKTSEKQNQNDTQKTDTKPENTPEDLDLDWQSIRVLTALNDANGQSNTREITDKTGLDNHVVNYRFKKLGENEHGLLRTSLPESLNNGRTPPKNVELTDTGRAAIKAGLLDDTSESSSTKTKIKQLEAKNRELKNQNNELEETLDAVIDDMVMLRKGFIMVEGALDDFFDGDLTEYLPENVDVSRSDYQPGDSK